MLYYVSKGAINPKATFNRTMSNPIRIGLWWSIMAAGWNGPIALEVKLPPRDMADQSQIVTIKAMGLVGGNTGRYPMGVRHCLPCPTGHPCERGVPPLPQTSRVRDDLSCPKRLLWYWHCHPHRSGPEGNQDMNYAWCPCLPDICVVWHYLIFTAPSAGHEDCTHGDHCRPTCTCPACR